MPITIPTTLADIVPQALRAYLATLTGIPSWKDFSTGIGTPDDGTTAYIGCLWTTGYSSPIQSYNRPFDTKQTHGIRLIMANKDFSKLNLLAFQWARTLDLYLQSTRTLSAMAKLGDNLAGTFEGVVVPASTCLQLETESWTIDIDANQGDGYTSNAGGIAVISCRFMVLMPS